MPKCLENLSNKDKEEYIRNKVSGILKQDIAIEYYINRKCQIDIAMEKGICVKTLYNKIKVIKEELEI